jgi:hypothetical protein
MFMQTIIKLVDLLGIIAKVRQLSIILKMRYQNLLTNSIK